ncbi:MAG TPA: dockerin type I domain-containing protein [Planctomycetota bacterium]|nr:dockerin type I domain-containing protein [Planctomycetota bacterium]
MMNADTGIDTLEVMQQFSIAFTGRKGSARIGDPDDGWKLPPGMNVRIGSESQRANLQMGRSDYQDCDGALILNGGDFVAYINTLSVGDNTRAAKAAGLLDLRDVGLLSIDALTVRIGVAPSGANSEGTVYLSEGSVTARNVEVGTHPTGLGFGYLELTGTDFAVQASLAMKKAGKITVNVDGNSCGIDLAPDATFTMDDPSSLIEINFLQEATATGIYYGLRWEGDHAADLQALADAGQLTWDDPAGIIVQDGCTYIGLTVSLASITSFGVTDRTSGSSIVTNEDVVTVAIIAEPAEGEIIDGYAVNETGIQPTEGWLPSLTSYTIIQAASGTHATLYAWAKDTAGNVGSKTATIYFNEASPVASAVVITDNSDGTATATWTTDIPAEGSLNYGPVAVPGATPNTVAAGAVGTSHSATFGFAAGTNYKIVVVNTEVASAPIYWPQPWPIEADANQDCRVNILDLIFIRNKLNQPVATGDNWKADVNEDTRINILDLIFVRNKLNTQCP